MLLPGVSARIRSGTGTHPGVVWGSQAAWLEHVCCMLLSLYFPVACKTSRAVPLPNFEVPHYRVTCPYVGRFRRERVAWLKSTLGGTTETSSHIQVWFPFPSEEWTTWMVLKTLTWMPRPEDGLDCLICAEFSWHRPAYPLGGLRMWFSLDCGRSPVSLRRNNKKKEVWLSARCFYEIFWQPYLTPSFEGLFAKFSSRLIRQLVLYISNSKG